MPLNAVSRSVYQHALCSIDQSSISQGKALENCRGPIKVMNPRRKSSCHINQLNRNVFSRTPSPSGLAASNTNICAKAIETAKLFWYDSMGCALGGSQQDDAKILLKHYRAMGGGNGGAHCFVSGFKTNPVDAAFLNDHMIRAMDYNDIYWKADPCHPSDIIAGPLALVREQGAQRQGPDPRDDHRVRDRNASLRSRPAGRARVRLASRDPEGVRGADRGGPGAESHAGADGSAMGISAARTFCPGAVTAGKLTNMKNTVDPWATRMGVESALLAREGFRPGAHDRWQGRLVRRLRSCAIQGRPAKFDAEALVADLPK